MKKNKESSFFQFSINSLKTSVGTQPKKTQFNLSHLRFSKKARSLIAVGIIAVILISAFVFLQRTSNNKSQDSPQSSDTPAASQSPSATPKQVHINQSPIELHPSSPGSNTIYVKPPDIIQSENPINNNTWIQVAKAAWSFFEPKIGVDEQTGLPYAGGADFKSFTDWDLGAYIQSIMDAQKIGLIGTDGDWGSYARLTKVLTFLETRELNATTHYPYWFYSATDGKNDHLVSDKTSDLDVVDTGRLFVALNNLRTYNSNYTQRINNIVYNQVENQVGNRTNYAALIPQIKSSGFASNDIYAYYFYSGFESFWSNDLHGLTAKILNNLFSSGTVVSYNVSLPKSTLTCEPLLCSFFELNNSDPRLTDLLKNVYLAHEANYNATGNYIAFSEGNGITTDFMYEWVVAPDGGTWKIQTSSQLGTASYTDMNPVVYCKVAFSFLALYDSSYAKSMVVYLEQALPDPSKGYYDGADNSGVIVSAVGSNTNGLILDAALYYIQSHSS